MIDFVLILLWVTLFIGSVGIIADHYDKRK